MEETRRSLFSHKKVQFENHFDEFSFIYSKLAKLLVPIFVYKVPILVYKVRISVFKVPILVYKVPIFVFIDTILVRDPGKESNHEFTRIKTKWLELIVSLRVSSSFALTHPTPSNR